MKLKTGKKIEKKNKKRSWVNKPDKSLAKCERKKKKTEINSVRNDKRDISADLYTSEG